MEFDACPAGTKTVYSTNYWISFKSTSTEYFWDNMANWAAVQIFDNGPIADRFRPWILFFLFLDRCRFFKFFWSSSRWETSFFITASIVRRFTTTLRYFSFRVFIQRFSHFGWDLFAPSSLVIIWPYKRRNLLWITRTTFITQLNA